MQLALRAALCRLPSALTPNTASVFATARPRRAQDT